MIGAEPCTPIEAILRIYTIIAMAINLFIHSICNTLK